MSRKMRLPSISFIVARSNPGNVIGCENALPWRLKSDLQRFRKITSGRAVIMGRKTFESIGRALPNRANIVLSRNSFIGNDQNILGTAETQILWANSNDQAFYFADVFSILNDRTEFFIIGGEQIYSYFFKLGLIRKVYLTEVYTQKEIVGDAFFKHTFPKKQWNLLSEDDFVASDDDEYGSRFMVYERKDRKDREAFVSKFFTGQPEKQIATELLRANFIKFENYAKKYPASEDQDAFIFSE